MEQSYNGKTAAEWRAYSKEFPRHGLQAHGESAMTALIQALDEIDRLHDALVTIAAGNTDPDQMVELAAKALR